MKRFEITYRSRFYSRRVERVEVFEAHSMNDALWHAARYASMLGLDADVREM